MNINIAPTLYLTEMVEEFRERMCPELSATQVMTGLINQSLANPDISFDDLLNSGDDEVLAMIRQHLWEGDIGDSAQA